MIAALAIIVVARVWLLKSFEIRALSASRLRQGGYAGSATINRGTAMQERPH
jgi:hypothetical protein